ncbi:MAG: response regulator [Candidatus Paceibacterota bacterium]
MNSSVVSILVVDDELSFCEVLKIGLQDEGYRCNISDGGAKAIKLLREEKFDLVVLDIRFVSESIDGFDVLKFIKKEYPKTKVIMMTAFSSEEGIWNEINAKKFGAEDFIRKPFALEMLLRDIKQVLENPPTIPKREEVSVSTNSATVVGEPGPIALIDAEHPL